MEGAPYSVSVRPLVRMVLECLPHYDHPLGYWSPSEAVAAVVPACHLLPGHAKLETKGNIAVQARMEEVGVVSWNCLARCHGRRTVVLCFHCLSTKSW